MSIYFKDKIKEIAERKMKEDLGSKGYSKDSDYFKSEEDYNDFFNLYDDEFDRYYLLTQIVNDLDKWHFYTSDNVYDEIIDEDYELEHMARYDFDIEDCLETAMTKDLVGGFIQLSDDLWMINDMY